MLLLKICTNQSGSLFGNLRYPLKKSILYNTKKQPPLFTKDFLFLHKPPHPSMTKNHNPSKTPTTSLQITYEQGRNRLPNKDPPLMILERARHLSGGAALLSKGVSAEDTANLQSLIFFLGGGS